MSYVIIPLIVLLATQLIKLATDGVKGNLDLRHIWISYGGMPSAHTAFAVSITTLVGIRLGVGNAIFAVALIFTLLIMRDAVTYRAMLGQQGQVINRLTRNLASTPNDIPQLPERLGHSVPEVLVGAIVGFCLTFLLSFV
jgi:hypothetical protein